MPKGYHDVEKYYQDDPNDELYELAHFNSIATEEDWFHYYWSNGFDSYCHSKKEYAGFPLMDEQTWVESLLWS